MEAFKRKRLFVDPKIQWALFRRVAVYWLSCIAAVHVVPVLLAAPLEVALPSLNRVWLYVVAQVAAIALFLPLIAYDMVRLSNRFVGPMLRLRRSMLRLASGESVDNLHFRDEDYWEELAEAFNAVVAHVESNKQASATSLSEHDEDETRYQEPVPVG